MTNTTKNIIEIYVAMTDDSLIYLILYINANMTNVILKTAQFSLPY
jgi:hypothetical protein